MPAPPPSRPASETVWCGARKGRTLSSPTPLGSAPATLWICVVSTASGKVSGGRIPGKRLASMVLPEPGGPIISTLCDPAAATSRARLAVPCPRTSLKSAQEASPPVSGAVPASCRTGSNLPCCWSNATTCARCSSANTRTPPAMAASAPLSDGTTRFRMPCLRAATAIESAPRTGRSVPSSDNSPTNK